MPVSPEVCYRFGPYRLAPADARLWRDAEVVPLTPKAFAVLGYLVERAGRLVTKRELLDTLWADVFVGDAALKVCVGEIRRALGDDPKAPAFIETAHRRGYRFVAGVTAEASSPALAPLVPMAPTLPVPVVAGVPAARPPETRYARSGEVNIAYQVVGNGPLDLVFVMGWVSHLDCFWTSPLFSRFLLRLASFTRLILFDKRGTGLSDRVAELPTLEQRMDDVRAVMDAVGSTGAVLLGVSEGGPMCSLFAATYPEKTLALVTIGTYAKRVWAPDYPWAPTQAQREHFHAIIRDEWGGPVGIEDRAPSLASDPEFRAWWATYLRMGASPGAALRLTRMNAEIDVRHVLPTIRVPTLVLHRVDDRCLRVEEGRYFAARIPGARLVELPGNDHLPFVGDQDAMLDEIEAFVTGRAPGVEADSVLATVLSAEIAEGGAASGGGGDTQGFEALVRREVTWFRGSSPEPHGSRFAAAFDGPARAIRCATALAGAAPRFGLALRAGVHTGECALADGRVGGIAVEIARAVSGCARPGEVLASRTVRDLVAGSGLQFEEAGVHPLPEAAGDGVLFRVSGEGGAGSAPRTTWTQSRT